MHYEQSTQGIRVRVEPRYSLADSDPQDREFVFSYHIEMANLGESAARLLYRFWRIHDSVGEDTEVEGEGVVGEQPRLEPGAEHRYQSFCVLRSTSGYMEGFYTFERPDGERFRVEVPRFHFTAPFMVAPDETGQDVMN
jgi:ApaG protein